MSEDPNWQRGLEQDRQRALSGQPIDNPSARSLRQSAGVDADAAEYYAAAAPSQVQQQQQQQQQPAFTGAPVAGPMGAPPAPLGGFAPAAVTPTAVPPSAHAYRYTPDAYPSDVDETDPRFGIRLVQLPPALEPKFGCKVGRLLYLTHPVSGYFKGSFSPDKVPMQLFVTPRSVWLGEAKSGKLVKCLDIHAIRSLLLLGDSGVGFRRAKGPDVFIKDLPKAERERLVTILTRLRDQEPAPLTVTAAAADDAVASAAMTPMRVERGGEKAEAAFRKEIMYFLEKEWEYALTEDPRSGLTLLPVPERNREHYAPLIPKPLHFFGGVHQVSLDGNGKTVGTRRGCWITPTCVFLSVHTGPERDGRGIMRCIPIENLTLVVNGPGFAVGMQADTKPPQPDCVVDLDDLAAKKLFLFVLERCFRFRTGHILNMRDAPHFDALRLMDERKFKATLHRMATVADLYGVLRGPIK